LLAAAKAENSTNNPPRSVDLIPGIHPIDAERGPSNEFRCGRRP
jgi:hypothetical protein